MISMEILTPSEECQKKLYDLQSQSNRRSTKINYNKIQLQVLNHYTPARNQLMRNDREQNSEHPMDMHHQNFQGDHSIRNRSLSYSKEERDLFGSPQSAVVGRTHVTGYNKKREHHHLQSQEPSTVKRFASHRTDLEENKDIAWATLATGDPEKKASNQQGEKMNHEQNKNEELRWRCELCTFLNKTTDKQCFLCLCSVIPSSEKDFITSSNALLENAEAANERVVKPWHCKYCTHINMWKKDICNLCSTPAGL